MQHLSVLKMLGKWRHDGWVNCPTDQCTVNNWFQVAKVIYKHRFPPYNITENEALFVIEIIPLQ